MDLLPKDTPDKEIGIDLGPLYNPIRTIQSKRNPSLITISEFAMDVILKNTLQRRRLLIDTNTTTEGKHILKTSYAV